MGEKSQSLDFTFKHLKIIKKFNTSDSACFSVYENMRDSCIQKTVACILVHFSLRCYGRFVATKRGNSVLFVRLKVKMELHISVFFLLCGPPQKQWNECMNSDWYDWVTYVRMPTLLAFTRTHNS